MSPAYLFSFKYSKSRQTGSRHAADSKLRYTKQFSILMLCAKYQEACLCGSRENVTEFLCDADADDARRRIVIPIMSPPLKRAGDTTNKQTNKQTWSKHQTLKFRFIMLLAISLLQHERIPVSFIYCFYKLADFYRLKARQICNAINTRYLRTYV